MRAIMKEKFSCRTNNAVLTVCVQDSTVHLTGMTANGRERLTASCFPMPAEYEKDGARIPFAWEFRTGEEKPDGFVLVFCDAAAGCEYRMEWTGRRDTAGPVEVSGSVINRSDETIRMIPGIVFSAEAAFETPPTAWRFMKESGVAEGLKWHNDPNVCFPGSGIYKDVLTEGITVTSWTTTHQDFNSGGMIPMIYFDGGEYGVYGAFEWSSCRIHGTGTAGGIRLTADLGENFSTRIVPGGDLMIPPFYFGVYDGDIEDGSNEFKRWFFRSKTPESFRRNPQEPLIQCDEQIHPEKASAMGIQSVKWDYGWWGEKQDVPGVLWKNHEGSWKLRAPEYIRTIQSRGCETMADYGAYLKSLGLNFTVYVLLHDSRVVLDENDQLTSVGVNGHPEWFSDRHVGPGALADLGNAECAEYCRQKLYEFFTENNVTTWRSDFEPIPHRSDKDNRHDANGTDVQSWCSRAFYDIVDDQIRRIPGFRYESCSSDGSMKDFATMRRASIFNTDDSADHSSLRTTFYDSSYCFPPAQLQFPCNGDTFAPECTAHYNGEGDLHYGMRALVMGGIMCSSWCGPKDGQYRYGLTEIYDEYCHLQNEKIKPLIRNANLYHTLPRPDYIHWDGMQYGCDGIPENGIGGALFLFKPTDAEGKEKTVKIRGLNPRLTYSVEFYERREQSFTATGQELMENGLRCVIPETPGSEIVFFAVRNDT